LAGLANGGGYYCKRERRGEKRLNGIRVSFWLLIVLLFCLQCFVLKKKVKMSMVSRSR
jgi:hypothetical protein